nr:hypothetical protein [Chloroflexota bacterium]
MNNGGPAAPGIGRESANLIVVCAPGSHAEQHADACIREAERMLGQILRQLDMAGDALQRPRKIVVRVGDTIPDPDAPGQSLDRGSASDPPAGVVSTAWRPDGPPEGLAEHLARVVLY